MHPSHLLGADEHAVLGVWAAWRRDGMGGAGHLPFAGGYAEQPAALMSALEAMAAAAARIRARSRPEK